MSCSAVQCAGGANGGLIPRVTRVQPAILSRTLVEHAWLKVHVSDCIGHSHTLCGAWLLQRGVGEHAPWTGSNACAISGQLWAG